MDILGDQYNHIFKKNGYRNANSIRSVNVLLQRLVGKMSESTKYSTRITYLELNRKLIFKKYRAKITKTILLYIWTIVLESLWIAIRIIYIYIYIYMGGKGSAYDEKKHNRNNRPYTNIHTTRSIIIMHAFVAPSFNLYIEVTVIRYTELHGIYLNDSVAPFVDETS